MFEHLAYLGALLASLACLVLIDHRWRLVLWRDRRASLYALAAGLVFFVAWDLSGIGLHIFYAGHPAWVTGWQLAPDLPVEELFFLLLLCYLPLLLWQAGAYRD